MVFKPDEFLKSDHPSVALLLRYHAKDLRVFQMMLEAPEQMQRMRFEKIKRLTSFSEYGEAFGIHKLDRLEDITNLPIQSYSAYRPWVERMAAGERNILSCEKTLGFMETSGTTGAAKWIPVTSEWQRSIQQGQRLWLLQLLCRYPQLTYTKTLSIVSSGHERQTKSGLPIGANTGRMKGAQPFWAKGSYVVPERIHDIEAVEAKIYATLRCALQAPIGLLVTANPSMILRYARGLEQWRSALEADLFDGTLRHGPAAELSPSLRNSLESKLSKSSLPSSWKMADLWPLQLVACWKGGPAGYFLDRIPKAIGAQIPIQEIGITASEGFFSLAMTPDDTGGLFWGGGHVVEFIDSEDNSHFAWSLKEGESYRLVISTENGLWRYDLNDTVVVTGFVGQLPLLRFVGKSGRYLNSVGEKVSEAQISELFRRMSLEQDLQAGGFTARIRWGECPQIVLAIESTVDWGAKLALQFDLQLQQLNLEYASKRKSGRLLPLDIERIPVGTYQAYRRQKISEGAPDGQMKDFILAPDTASWLAFCRDTGLS